MKSPGDSRFRKATIAILLLFVMAALDYATGYEMVFSAAYLVPVSLCSWYFGRGAILMMALAGGIATWIVDRVSGQPYSHFLIHYWNSFVCFLISALVGLILYRLRMALQQKEIANSRLEQALAALERSTEEIRKLQSGLQVVCAWTQRIKVGEKWMTADQFLIEKLNLKLSHGMSPEGQEEFERGLAARLGPAETTQALTQA